MKDDKPKIMFVATVKPGGISTVLKNVLTDKKIKDNFEMSVCLVRVLQDKNFLSGLQDTNLIEPKNNGKICCTTNLLKSLIKFNGQAVIALGPVQVFLAKAIKVLFRKKYKVISWIHASNVDPGLRKKYPLLRFADGNLAISSGITDELEDMGIPEKKITLVYNPVSEEKTNIYPLSDGCLFIYTGRIQLCEQKNLSGIFEALSHVSGNWQLKVFGNGPDLDNAKDLVEHNPNLKGKVVFMGWKANPWGDIKNANALLLDSNYEGFGMAIAEALSYGVPCISSDCPVGPSDLIKPGENGYLFPIGDNQKFRKYLSDFSSHEVTFDPKKVKKTISFLYGDNYSTRFVSAVKKFLNQN